MATTELPIYTKKDFQTDQEIRWCPGCGDYAILSAVQMVFADLRIPKEKLVFISGIGCSSRFPYYMNAFGFHTIHGRAPAVATGVKLVRPDLDVWVATGDGDSLSIGGNHTIHMLRRNVGLKVLMFNNKIYGLTKGQYSPTSEVGKKTKSTPFGSVDRPFNPLSLAIGSEATFVARSVDVFQAPPERNSEESRGPQRLGLRRNSAELQHLQRRRLGFHHRKDARSEHVVQLEHGKPLIFGKNRDKGIRLNGLELEVVTLGNGVTEKDLLVHDEHNANPVYAFAIARMDTMPGFPTPIGVFRSIAGVPQYEDLVNATNRRRPGQKRQRRSSQAPPRRRHLGTPRLVSLFCTKVTGRAGLQPRRKSPCYVGGFSP